MERETLTSPSLGRHLDPCKAIIQNPDLLRTFNVKILNLLVLNGLSLDRWKSAINVLIEKDPSKPRLRLNRLCVLHLFEADYNFILKLLWGSRLVWKGERIDKLNNDQHSLRHDRQGLDLVHVLAHQHGSMSDSQTGHGKLRQQCKCLL
jgi:hypothetical protein